MRPTDHRYVWPWRALALLAALGTVAGQMDGQVRHRGGDSTGARVFGVTFADTAPYVLRVDAATGRTAFTIELANADSTAHTVLLRIAHDPLQAIDAAPERELRFAPDRLVVPALSRARARLELAVPPERISGTWSTYAVLQDAASSRRVAVRQVWVVAPLVQPLVSAWTVHAWRWLPAPCCVVISGGTGVLPLAAPIATSIGPVGAHVATLRDSGGGDVGWLRWADTTATAADGRPGLALDIVHAGAIGSYDATLPFDSLYGASALGVHYTLTDAVYLPLIVLLCGVWVAYRAQDYFTVRRPALGLAETLAAVGDRWNEIRTDLQRQFPTTKYDITASVEREQIELRSEANAVAQNAYPSAADQEAAYKSLTDKVQAFADGVRSWAVLAPRLSTLVEVRTRAAAAAATYDPTRLLGERPALIDVADQLVIGRPHEWGDAAACVKAVQDLADSLDQWIGYVDELTRDRQLLATATAKAPRAPAAPPLAGTSKAPPDPLADARKDLATAEARLWTAHTADDLKSSALSDALNGFLTNLGLAGTHVAVRAPGFAAFGVKAAVGPLAGVDIGALLAAVNEGNAQQKVDVRAPRRRYDRRFLALAAGVAALSGLKVLYFGHPFGRPEDYLTAALWGFGTQLSLATIADGLKRLAGSLSLGIKS